MKEYEKCVNGYFGEIFDWKIVDVLKRMIWNKKNIFWNRECRIVNEIVNVGCECLFFLVGGLVGFVY